MATNSNQHSTPSCHHHSGQHEPSCHSKKRVDLLLWGSLAAVVGLYGLEVFAPGLGYRLGDMSAAAFELVNTMWWGLLLGVIMLSLLTRVPREFVMSVLGQKAGVSGIARATAAGLMLDLCSHGILMVGAKLYERGASLGQVMAFLIASPWNSFSLTLVLFALIGVGWTLIFIAASLLIAMISGLLFDLFVRRGTLPANPNSTDLPDDFQFWASARQGLANTRFDRQFFLSMFKDGLSESRMVMRWIFFGVVLAAALRGLVPTDLFQEYFGPSLLGLAATVLAATIIEVCSEGSTPIAADLLTRANAPGNAFAFLMTGVSTDYTEIMVMKERTGSWKIALFLPLLTVPQVLAIAWVLNL